MNTILLNILEKIFTGGVTALWENKNHISLYLKTLFWKYRNKDVRFSISYLFRIRIPESNNYLLVLNRRIENQLQPVGGVYKRYGDDKLFESWNYKLDNQTNGINVDKESEGDLRFTVKGKYVIKVIRWFNENKEREISAEREFREELIDTEILDKKLFNKIKYKHIKRCSKHLKWSMYHNCYEILIYDIFEFIPNSSQSDYLLKLNKSKTLNKGYAIVGSDDIEQLRFMKKGKQIARIGEHSKLIINKTF